MKFYTFYRENNQFTDIENDPIVKRFADLKIRWYNHYMIGISTYIKDSDQYFSLLTLKYGEDMIQSTGSSGTTIINGLANATTVSISTNTQVFIPVSVGAGQTESLNLPEDGILYAGRGGFGIVDGIGVTGNTSALIVTLFIDK